MCSEKKEFSMNNKKRFHALLSFMCFVILALFLAGCARNAKAEDHAPLRGTVWSVADVTIDGNTYSVDEMIKRNLDAPGITRFFEFTDDANSYLLVVVDGKVFEVIHFGYNYDGEALSFESSDILKASYANNSLSILFAGGNEYRFTKTDEDIIDPTVGAAVTFLPEPTTEAPTEAPTDDDVIPESSDGRFVYQIDGHDWTIGIRIEDLIHDGQIDASELHIALGFDRSGDLRDANNTVIARSVGFLAGAKHGPNDTVTLMGNANYPGARIFYNFMSENSEDVVTVVAGPRSFRVALNQLVVAIYGCEQYMDGELHDDVYGDLLENYVSSETYYLIP